MFSAIIKDLLLVDNILLLVIQQKACKYQVVGMSKSFIELIKVSIQISFDPFDTNNIVVKQEMDC